MKMKSSLKREKISEAITAYFMILPDLIGLMVFIFIPMIFALVVSFHQWNGLETMLFIGVGNFREMMHDEVFWGSIKTTLQYALIYVPSVFCISLMLALLVHSIKGTAQQIYRITYFFPFAISTVTAALAWIFIFHPTKGYLNELLGFFGIGKQSFLASMEQALPSVAAVGIWMIIGYNMVIFLASIKDIPKEFYEASEIDGVNSIQKFIYITFPLLRETSLFIVIVTTIGSFQAFDQIRVMTKGGPALATNTTVYYIFNQAFEVFKIGYASSIASVLFIIILSLTLIQFNLSSKKGE